VQNHSRHLVAILRELCGERRIELTSFSNDWVHRLEKDGRVTHVIGYDFAINAASSRMIARDKAATSAILSHERIPVVEHTLFHAPAMAEYVPHAGNWVTMLDFFRARNRLVVCKPNEGTGGTDVFRVSSELELEAAVSRVFERHRTLCLCPFVDVVSEVRCVVVDGRCCVAYEKVRPGVFGDGTSTRAQLVAAQQGPETRSRSGRGLAPDASALEWAEVPAVGQRVLLDWRHNLGVGAGVSMLSESDERFSALRTLALRAAAALQLRAASVDLFVTDREVMVLEVNAGIMMEKFSAQSVETRAIARAVYARILDALWS
jgi:glutathione synthase/RimK-type ligase-like ATP-grasp enzyme